MRVQLLPLTAVLLSYASAVIINIDVGEDGLSFSPNSATAATGDTVVFHFYPGKHSVVEGSFDSPCAPLANGFYSGYLDSSSGESETTFVVTVNDTNPIWFYCSQVGHCQNGMVGVINQPSSGNTLEEYSAASANTQKSTTPNNVGGGVFANGGGSSSSASGSAASAAKTVVIETTTLSVVSGAQTTPTGTSSTSNMASKAAGSSTSSPTTSSKPATDTSAASVTTGGLSGGAKGGIAVGAILLAVIAVAIIFFLFRRRRKRSKQPEPGPVIRESELPTQANTHEVHGDDRNVENVVLNIPEIAGEEIPTPSNEHEIGISGKESLTSVRRHELGSPPRSPDSQSRTPQQAPQSPGVIQTFSQPFDPDVLALEQDYRDISPVQDPQLVGLSSPLHVASRDTPAESDKSMSLSRLEILRAQQDKIIAEKVRLARLQELEEREAEIQREIMEEERKQKRGS